ncbi:hypothetical protein H8D30_03310 [bacterium]|nr:hypothetical protein [bacterium]
MPFLADKLKLIRRFLVDSGGEIAAADHIEEMAFGPSRLDLRENTTVHEGGIIQPLEGVLEGGEEKIAWFMDGIQHTHLVGACELGDTRLAVHYAIIASLIIQTTRNGFQMFGPPRIEEFGLLSQSHLGCALPEGFTDTGAKSGYFSDQRRSAVFAVRKLRHKLESEHLLDWVKERGGQETILVDGSLSHLPEGVPHAVGLCKDNHPLFLSSEQQRRTHSLGYGERSALFTFRNDLGAEITSWFLRIRQPMGHTSSFGLVRPEIYSGYPIPPTEVDVISRRVFALRNPVAYPRPKWERLIYPVRVCTEFLTNHLPKTETIKWYLHGAMAV